MLLEIMTSVQLANIMCSDKIIIVERRFLTIATGPFIALNENANEQHIAEKSPASVRLTSSLRNALSMSLVTASK
jgi:hypothetical protein